MPATSRCRRPVELLQHVPLPQAMLMMLMMPMLILILILMPMMMMMMIMMMIMMMMMMMMRMMMRMLTTTMTIRKKTVMVVMMMSMVMMWMVTTTTATKIMMRLMMVVVTMLDGDDDDGDDEDDDNDDEEDRHRFILIIVVIVMAMTIMRHSKARQSVVFASSRPQTGVVLLNHMKFTRSDRTVCASISQANPSSNARRESDAASQRPFHAADAGFGFPSGTVLAHSVHVSPACGRRKTSCACAPPIRDSRNCRRKCSRHVGVSRTAQRHLPLCSPHLAGQLCPSHWHEGS